MCVAPQKRRHPRKISDKRGRPLGYTISHKKNDARHLIIILSYLFNEWNICHFSPVICLFIHIYIYDRFNRGLQLFLVREYKRSIMNLRVVCDCCRSRAEVRRVACRRRGGDSPGYRFCDVVAIIYISSLCRPTYNRVFSHFHSIPFLCT